MPSSTNPEGDLHDAVTSVKKMLDQTAHHARDEVRKVQDVRAKALFETTAEALDGLKKAYTDFEKKDEEAWR